MRRVIHIVVPWKSSERSFTKIVCDFFLGSWEIFRQRGQSQRGVAHPGALASLCREFVVRDVLLVTC